LNRENPDWNANWSKEAKGHRKSWSEKGDSLTCCCDAA